MVYIFESDFQDSIIHKLASGGACQLHCTCVMGLCVPYNAFLVLHLCSICTLPSVLYPVYVTFLYLIKPHGH